MPPSWWDESELKRANAVFTRVKAIEDAQPEIHEMNVRHARLYSNTDMMGLDWSLGPRTETRRPIRSTENVIQSVIDTASSMIAKNRPRAAFITEQGEFSDQQKAKRLERFVEGVFQREEIYDKGVDAFRDATVFGTGALRFSENQLESKVNIDRVIVDEIIVDELACRSGYPRELFQRRFVDRDVLKGLFPEKSESIDRAAVPFADSQWWHVPKNIVMVVEGWHLPSPNENDGRYVMSLENDWLIWDNYHDDFFPFLFYRWSKPICGFYGQGLAEQLTGHQLRINELNKFIDKAQDLIAVPRVWLDAASKALKPQITNEIGAIIPYKGRPPIFNTAQAVGPEIYQYKELLKRSAFEFAGISQLAAQSKKPPALESGVALREFNDIESQRFSIQAQRYEEIFIEAARMIVRMAARLNKRRPFKTVFAANNFRETINWKDVDLDEDRYTIKVESASILSRTPAGRLQAVVDMFQSGLIGVDEGRRLLGNPDVNKERSLASASIDVIDMIIESLRDGEYVPPEPFMDLQFAIKRIGQAYLRAKMEGAPDDILQGFRDFMDQANALIMKAQQPPPGMMPPGMAPPEAPNGQPPNDGGLPLDEGAALPEQLQLPVQ